MKVKIFYEICMIFLGFFLGFMRFIWDL